MAFLLVLEQVFPVPAFPKRDHPSVSGQMQGKRFQKKCKIMLSMTQWSSCSGLFCDKHNSLPWLGQCQEFSRHFPVQEEVMGLGQKKCLMVH